MRRFLLALVAAASFSLAASAQVGGLSFPGPQSPPQSGGGYTPPLDAIGQASVLRAYSTCRMFTAYNSNLLHVVGGTGTTDYPALSTGCVDWTAIQAQCSTATTCTAYFYDQSGNAANMTINGTAAYVHPTGKYLYTVNTGGTASYWTFTGAAQAQPFSLVANYNISYSSANPSMLFADGVNVEVVDAGNQVGIYANGTIQSGTFTDGTWGAVAALFNTTSSTLTLNNGSNLISGSPGTSGIATGTWALSTNPGSTGYYQIGMKVDTFVIFNTNPGSTALSNFVTWIRSNMCTAC